MHNRPGGAGGIGGEGLKAVLIAFTTVIALPVLALGGVSEASFGAPVIPEGDLVAEVLSNPAIKLSSAADSDVRSGIADPRLLSVLLILADEHILDRVGPIRTGHSYYIRGTRRASNHSFGRAVDISWVDGARVSVSNEAALRATETILSLPEPLRPDEVGSPWELPSRGSFSDGDHRGHIHVGWS